MTRRLVSQTRVWKRCSHLSGMRKCQKHKQNVSEKQKAKKRECGKDAFISRVCVSVKRDLAIGQQMHINISIRQIYKPPLAPPLLPLILFLPRAIANARAALA